MTPYIYAGLPKTAQNSIILKTIHDKTYSTILYDKLRVVNGVLFIASNTWPNEVYITETEKLDTRYSKYPMVRQFACLVLSAMGYNNSKISWVFSRNVSYCRCSILRAYEFLYDDEYKKFFKNVIEYLHEEGIINSKTYRTLDYECEHPKKI